MSDPRHRLEPGEDAEPAETATSVDEGMLIDWAPPPDPLESPNPVESLDFDTVAPTPSTGTATGPALYTPPVRMHTASGTGPAQWVESDAL
ncbi:MAG: hypothetical protein ABIQ01_09470 [Pseudolysinimonas sp.]